MGKFSALSSILAQWTKLPPVKNVDLSERTVMVVGANIGLGLEAARHYARLRPKHLILACRSKSKGEAAIADIKESTGFTAELLLVDLASFASVSSFASAFEEKYDRLDVLALNAAIVQFHYEATVDGLEVNTQVNYLSIMFIALLLLPTMQRTAEIHHTYPHLTVTGSDTHFMAKVSSELANSPAPVSYITSEEHSTVKDLQARYALTKLLDMLLVRGITERLPPSSAVIVNSANPGFCYSNIRRNSRSFRAIQFRLMEIILARETAEGAKTIVHAGLAGLPEEEVTEREAMRGAYMNNCKPEEPADWLFSKQGIEFEAKVWAESVDLLSKKDSRIDNIINQYISRPV